MGSGQNAAFADSGKMSINKDAEAANGDPADRRSGFGIDEVIWQFVARCKGERIEIENDEVDRFSNFERACHAIKGGAAGTVDCAAS